MELGIAEVMGARKVIIDHRAVNGRRTCRPQPPFRIFNNQGLISGG
jgi:hypothetical protein